MSEALDRTELPSVFFTDQMAADCFALKDYYGSHANVARLVGLTPRHYHRIRHGEIVPTETVLKLLDVYANIVKRSDRSKEILKLVPRL